MTYIDIFQASVIVLFVAGYSVLALVLVGRAMIDLSSAVIRTPVVRSDSTRPRQ